MSDLLSIFSCTQKQYAEQVQQRLGRGRLHARKLYTEWFRQATRQALWAEPQAALLLEKIVDNTYFFAADLVWEQEEGGVRKFLLRLQEGKEVESVIIPMQFGFTLCVSSQLGCARGCAFCQTGKMGCLRSLSVEEIVYQVFVAKFVLRVPIRNIVFMGMGEPFDNYDAVRQAILVLTDPYGLGSSLRYITVSTSGKVPEIMRFATDTSIAARLAVSLNAPNDQVRDRIMPINKLWNLAALKEALSLYHAETGKEILIEYVLLAGINDSLSAAEEVAEYLADFPVRINLIPYNSQKRGPFSAPEESVCDAFQKQLQKKGYRVLMRRNKGRSIMAACGQLGSSREGALAAISNCR